MSAIGTSWGWGTRMTYLIFIAQRIGEESSRVLSHLLHLLHILSAVGVSYFCVCYYNSSRSDITVVVLVQPKELRNVPSSSI